MSSLKQWQVHTNSHSKCAKPTRPQKWFTSWHCLKNQAMKIMNLFQSMRHQSQFMFLINDILMFILARSANNLPHDHDSYKRATYISGLICGIHVCGI